METEPVIAGELTAYDLFKVRLRLSARNLAGFCTQLLRHPTAVLGLVIVLAYVAAAVFAPYLVPGDPTLGGLHYRLTPPAWQKGGTAKFPLGTDQLGRDMLSRIIYGSRVSIWIGLVSVVISVAVGVILGAVCGYYRGWLDEVLSRLAELLLAFPFLIFAIGVMAIVGPGFANLITALIFKSWVEFFRLARGEMLSEKTKEYVEAAKALGQSDAATIVSEIMPNIIHSVIVLATLRMGYMIITEASLSFLGIGVQPGIPAWGSMVADGRDFLVTAWWVATMPGLALLVLVLGINMFGEGLRDILDPRLKID